MDVNINKLPKWAQRHIKRLEETVARQEDFIQGVLTEAEGDFQYKPGNLPSKVLSLPANSKIYAPIDDGYLEIERNSPSSIKVRSTSPGQMVVEPDVSNVIRVRVTDR